MITLKASLCIRQIFLFTSLFALTPLVSTAQLNKELTEAELVEYRPEETKASKKVWDRFYAGDYEADLPKPLIKGGKTMVPAICEAITNPNMRLRRYAITALGEIGDKTALPTLETILKDKKELEYMRGDALEAIHRLDQVLGLKYAQEFKNTNDYLKMVAGEIMKP